MSPSSKNKPDSGLLWARPAALVFTLPDTNIEKIIKELRLGGPDIPFLIEAALKTNLGPNTLLPLSTPEALQMAVAMAAPPATRKPTTGGGKGAKGSAGSGNVSKAADPMISAANAQLQQAQKAIETALKESPMGAWLDEKDHRLYLVGVEILLAGGASIFLTKTGDPIAQYAFKQIAGRKIQVYSVGDVSASLSGLSLQPQSQAGTVTVDSKWKWLPLSVQVQAAAVNSRAKIVGNQIMAKIAPVNLSVANTSQGLQQTIGVGLKAFGGQLDINAAVLNGKVAKEEVTFSLPAGKDSDNKFEIEANRTQGPGSPQWEVIGQLSFKF